MISGMSTDGYPYDLSILRLIEGAPDFSVPEVALALADVCAALALGDREDFLAEFAGDPENDAIVPLLDGFVDWINETSADDFDTEDGFVRFAQDIRGEAIELILSDSPEVPMASEIPEGRLDAAGDYIVGSALFWTFMSETEQVTPEQGEIWSGLWTSYAVADMLGTASPEPEPEPSQLEEQWAEPVPQAPAPEAWVAPQPVLPSPRIEPDLDDDTPADAMPLAGSRRMARAPYDPQPSIDHWDATHAPASGVDEDSDWS